MKNDKQNDLNNKLNHIGEQDYNDKKEEKENKQESSNKNFLSNFRKKHSKKRDNDNTSKRLKRIAKIASKLPPMIISIVTNPITWVASFLILFMFVILSGISVLGPSDYGRNCATAEQTNNAAANAKDPGKQKVTVTVDSSVDKLSGHDLAKALADAVAKAVKVKDPSWLYAQIMLESGNMSASAVASKNLTGINGGPSTSFSSWSDFASVWASTLASDGAANWQSLNDMNRMLSGSALGKECNYYCYKSPDSQYSTQAAEEAAYLKMLTSLAKGYNGSSTNTGGGSESGDTDHCTSDDPASTSNILKFAESIAYPENQQSKGNVTCSTYNGCGADVAPDAYKKAHAQAEKSGKDGFSEFYASCDRFVATVVKDTVDKSFPWGATGQQVDYLNKSSKWKKIDCKNAQAGDVVEAVTQSGSGDNHAMIYGGGKTIVSASIAVGAEGRVGTIHQGYGGGCSGSLMTNVDGHSYGQAFRYSGTPDPSK